MPITYKVLIFIATIIFLYFGYKDDFARNKKETVYIASIVFVMMTTFLSMFRTNITLAIIVSFAIGSSGYFLKSKLLSYFGEKE